MEADSIRSITDSKLFEEAFNDFEPEVVLRVRNLLRTRGLYLDLARSNEDLERELRRKN